MKPIGKVCSSVLSLFFVFCMGPLDSFAQTVPGGNQPSQALPDDVPSIAPIPRAQRTLDLVVTITLNTGKAETFAREVDRLEIVKFPDGRIDMVHLVLISGGERNTHVWYNFSQLSKLSYRFVTPEGRDRVRVRVIQGAAPVRELAERIEPLDARDFK